MSNKTNEFVVDLAALLDRQKSKTQINNDIKELEKSLRKIRLVATLAKGDTKSEVNQIIRQLEAQLRQIRLQAKMDSRQLNREIDAALRNVSAREIQVNFDEGRLNTQIRRALSQAREYAGRNPISVNVDLKREKLLNQLDTFLNKHTKINESTYWLGEAERLREVIGSVTNRDELRNATDQLQVFTSGVRATGYAAVSTTDRIRNMLGGVVKIGNYLGLATLAISKFRQSLNTLKENDSILTEISKTSEMTKNQLKELGDEAFAVASKYGQVSGNYLLAVQEMARSGYESLSKELGELSLLAQSAGDMTAEMANNYILATDAAYKYGGSVEKLNAALDGANFISNKNSANLTEIASATSVSASFAANAGVAIDELTAAEATMIAVTKRSGSEIGRAFRSILLNLQQVSGELDDGEVIDEEQLKKVEARCHSLGVELEYVKDGVATLRNPMEVLKELSEVYNSLPDDSADKQGLISDLGGKYHANSLSALLSRWDLYEKMLGEFSQGTGSALEEANKTADSWAGRLAQLQNSWDSFVNSVTNQEMVKGSISFLDGTIQAFEKLTNTLGAIPVLLTTINAGMAGLNKNYGITGLYNKETHKIDVQGNFMGVNITEYKKQVKHYQEAASAMEEWNQKMVAGVTNINDFENATVQNNAHLKAYLQTTSVEAPASLEGYKNYLRSAGVATDALRLKTMLLTSAFTFGLSFAIQFVISGIMKIANAGKEAAQSAKELGDAFNQTKSEIEDYKTKIEELHDTINDSGSSIEDVTNARKELMSIQDEMIEKYGAEKGAVLDITNAINGQADAFDRLLGKQWQATKNEFNKSNIWKDIANAFSGYEDNIDRMMSEYGNHTATLDITRTGMDQTELQKYEELLRSFEGVEIAGFDGGRQLAVLNGNATEVYNTILEIQELSEGFDIGASLEKDLTEAANSAKEVSDTYKNMFDQYVLNEKVFKDTGYIEIYKGLTKAYEQYQDAMLSGDEEKLKEKTDAYAKYLTESLENVKDEDVSDFLQNMFPEMQEKVAEWKFQLNFEPNIENYGFQNRLQNALDSLGGKSMEGILGLNLQAASEKEKEGYYELTEIACEYGMELTWLLSLLEQMGMVQTESYQQLAKTFGQENIENLKPEDLEIAYKIENVGDMTFEEFQEEIRKMKESAETAPTFSSTLSQVESLSEGLDQLDKIYADIYDKEEFDWSSILNNEGFSKVFGGFTDEYENFIQTISNNTSDIEACQDAFDRLATAYINNSEAMKNLTPETKDATIAMLEQMGVMNAEEVVTSRLAAQEAFLAAKKADATIESENLADASWEDVAATLASGEAADIASSYLTQLALSKLDINNNPINSDKDIDAIIAIANAAGRSTEYVNALKTALTNLQNAQASVQNAKNSKFMGAAKALNISLAESMEDNAQKAVDDLLNDLKNGIGNNQLDPADFYAKVNYGGGSATKDAIDKANKEKSGSKKEAEKEEKETKETFNWIETAISRVQRLITKLKDTVSSTYKSWTTRNHALGNELHTITEELSHQQRAYEKYMGLANGVGLDGYYQHLVQIGDINLSEITDETLKEQIKQYKEYYEKALDAADAVEELKDSMAELAKVKFDNLTKQFEDQINAIEKRVSIIDSKVNQIKEMGYMLNKAFYEEAADYTRRNLSELQNEYSTLSFALKKAVDDGDIAEYSEEWHNMKSQINEVEQAIIEANTSLIEYSNTLRELEWEKFDMLQDHISGITEETEFLIDLLSNDSLIRDKGVFSIFGEATLGLHSLSYESYLRQAKDYAEELEKIEASIANDKNNTKLLERREELLKLQRENILSAQAEKQAIRDLYEDSFKTMLSHLQELIDKRKEALKAEKDLYDYQKNVAKQTKEIAAYQKQLDAYAGDTSEETKATIQKLKVSLEDAKQELKDTEYDKWISDQERLMDELYNEYEILLNKRLDNIDGLMKEAISQTNANSRDILSTIIATSSEVGYTITDAMGTIWGMDGGIGKVLSDYSSTFVATMSNLQLSVDAIKNYIAQIDQNNLPENKLEGDAVNGWRNENGAWSYYENNQKLSNTWVKDKGKYYHLNANGTMDANTWVWNDSGTWSYVDGGGAAMTGWQYLHWNGRDAWFNFDENGIMKVNEWINDYFVDAYGYMRSNEWIGHNGKYYWVGADGKWLDLPGWSLDERPKDGLPIYEYAKGSNYIPSDRIAWTQENGKGEAIYRKSDGALLTPLGKGDAVFTPEKTEKLLKMLRGDSYIPEQNLGIKATDYGTIQNIQNIQNTQNSQPVTNITFGDITLPDVLNSKQFVNSVEQIMRDAMCRNGQTKRCITEAITAPMLGKGKLTAYRYR